MGKLHSAGGYDKILYLLAFQNDILIILQEFH